jgi:hypothetical protein
LFLPLNSLCFFFLFPFFFLDITLVFKESCVKFLSKITVLFDVLNLSIEVVGQEDGHEQIYDIAEEFILESFCS